MKIIAIGDIHGRSTWEKFVKNIGLDDIVVFIGDYFDSFDVPSVDQLKNFQRIIRYKKARKNHVKLLIGNHDFHYMDPKISNHDMYSGFQEKAYEAINKEVMAAFNEGILQIAYEKGGYLFTHAGVTNEWCENNGIYPHSPRMATRLGTKLRTQPWAFCFDRRPGCSSYGDNTYQSPIWVRPGSLEKDMIPYYTQVVGHTRQDGVTDKGRVIYIDALDTSEEFLTLELPDETPPKQEKKIKDDPIIPVKKNVILEPPTYAEIKPYIEKGLIDEKEHPEDPNVRIFNYTQECQFSKAWDPVTKQCRGLIMNIVTGEILARPFPKFFNLQEHLEKGHKLPKEVPQVKEKFDGSLGILYALNKKPYIATRGSFVSDQAKWATEWYRKNVSKKVNWNKELTHLFEIIYPENKIVVNYEFSGLVYLGSLSIENGKELEGAQWKEPVKIAQKITFDTVGDLLNQNNPNEEGYVLRYKENDLRLKIKFPEYVRLHKILTGLSEIGIWEHMKDEKPLAPLLEKVPDEFFKWVQQVYKKIQKEFDTIEKVSESEYKKIKGKSEETWTRKDWAENIKNMTYPQIGFSILDGKKYDSTIWRMVRPKGQSIFKKDIDQ